ncbi:replication initiator protein A [Leuconostoc gelidum subsp. gasicomitatum]|nr:replication initiator protein A [Leuconostoc gasicomitatum]MBZ5969810.1 replication initiator protein A [Leuconostoc gasicomitatum]MBZ5994784.1 replication initiator protein A [Leuconostoc gasicomitatum]MBZ5998223.1 replication initiator protein A [Leuconostoc gasicomitatum]
MYITPNRLSRIERKIGRVYADEIAALARVLEIPEVELPNEVDRYRNFKLSMKLESKMVYSILKDRFKLSLENNWVDKQGNVYLYYSNIKLGEKLGVGKGKVIRIKKELQKFGLLEEEHQGFNKPN